tara:strand:- start:330 stop:560 length:231 start_codon:yes stop_codon:yes gene_type:complete
MHREWADYLRSLPFKTRFLYQDTMPEHLGEISLPAAFVVENDQWVPVIGSEEMDKASTLEALIELCNTSLADYIDA